MVRRFALRVATLFATLFVALLAALGAAASRAWAQAAPADSTAAGAVANAAATARRAVFVRAQRLVNDGNGAAGRALMDSLVGAAAPRSPEEADALFWRATLAESWDAAQRDYLRVMLEHDRTPQAAEAMLRLAQGEATRGDRDAALRYLERLAATTPDTPLRAEATLWQGRILIDRGARADGCVLLRDGRALVRAGALELENQYDYLLRGCAASVGAVPSEATPAPTPPAAPPPSPTAQPAPSGGAPSAPSGARVWSVQIAAFPDLATARSFADEIRARGYDTRVDGTTAPFRVRFGRYATREEAARAMDAYTTKERSEAFLTQVPRE